MVYVFCKDHSFTSQSWSNCFSYVVIKVSCQIKEINAKSMCDWRSAETGLVIIWDIKNYQPIYRDNRQSIISLSNHYRNNITTESSFHFSHCFILLDQVLTIWCYIYYRTIFYFQSCKDRFLLFFACSLLENLHKTSSCLTFILTVWP